MLEDGAMRTATDEVATIAPVGEQKPLAFHQRLSGKLLLLTVLFVMIAEVLIFIPSLASMRLGWLHDRLATAAAASVVIAASKAGSIPRSVQDSVLMATGTKAIALREKGVSRLLVVSDMPPTVDRHIDLARTGPVQAIVDAFDTLIFGGDRIIRVYGPIGDSKEVIELVTSDAPLKAAMLAYLRNIALVSLIISLITAGLVFFAINGLLIRPICLMTENMLAFARNPHDPARIMRFDKRPDELGIAERELASMQAALQRTLAEQKHLADLGLAVSKINHDLRNILASAQLMSDRLTQVEDPSVKRFAPKLIRTLDRAVAYTQSVLSYGRAQEAPPARRRIRLYGLVADVEQMAGIEAETGTSFRNLVPEDFEIDADPEQFFRVISNLCRNAVQAMTADPASDAPLVRRLTVTAGRIGTTAIIGIEDTGPGLSPKARENLFSAFRGSTRPDGTGLGLAIAHELVRAHGGTLELREGGGSGAHFEIRIPDGPVSLADWRKERGSVSG
jgi:signal transduction histidine kinase